jgi:hypothetical protein
MLQKFDIAFPERLFRTPEFEFRRRDGADRGTLRSPGDDEKRRVRFEEGRELLSSAAGRPVPQAERFILRGREMILKLPRQ